jgi:hypothetical protein
MGTGDGAYMSTGGGMGDGWGGLKATPPPKNFADTAGKNFLLRKIAKFGAKTAKFQ